MAAIKPIFWHQGLFLQPQHFQQSEAFQDFKHSALRKYDLKHFYGVGQMEINEPGLGNKLFEVLSGEFIFPDGSYVIFPGNAAIPSRSFDEAWVESEKPFTVYLGLNRSSVDNANVTSVQSLTDTASVNTRFATSYDPDDVADVMSDGPSAKVKMLTYSLKIFWETEVESVTDYHMFPIAQLVREGDDVMLSREFIPPCLSIRASSRLEGFIKEIRDLVGSRARQLEEYKSPKDLQGMDLEIRFLVFLLALRSLNRFVPLLYHYTEVKHVHPWELYGLIRQLLGELSTFSERLNAFCEDKAGNRMLPSYDHENLFQCFSTARHLIARFLEGIIMGPEYLIRLEYDGEYYSAEAPDTMFDGENAYWLVLRTTLPEETILDDMLHVLKLSAAKNLTTLIARAVPGIPLEHFAETPSGLPRSPSAHYFLIDKTSHQWADVEKTRNISLYWDTAPKDLAAEIIVLKG